MVPVATNTFTFITDRVIVDLDICTYTVQESTRINLLLSLISRISVIAADILVLVVTWMKTARSYSEARRLKIETPLSMMLIRDGTLYFVILLMVNVLQVFGQNIPILFSLNITEPFFQNLPPIIVRRFILNLRQIKPAGNSWVSGNQSHGLRIVGNLGESLQFGADEEVDNEIEEDTNPAEPHDSPKFAAEVSSSGELEVNEGETSIYSDFGIQEVPRHHDV
ncbi:hypothetical protein BC629DRAFT_790526 [Irpex lacteus]|nr:hypothetical protein BC629DRAFT_790526 [Irpex lacteus]